MPLTKEFRLFFLDGELMYSAEYWDEGDYAGAAVPEGLSPTSRGASRAASSRWTWHI